MKENIGNFNKEKIVDFHHLLKEILKQMMNDLKGLIQSSLRKERSCARHSYQLNKCPILENERSLVEKELCL